MGKKQSYVPYVKLLQEAIQEYDSKALDLKGPLLEPIISYRSEEGKEELKTNSDASDILERYYFREKGGSTSDKLVEQDDVLDAKGEVKTDEPTEENEINTGEKPEEIDKTLDELEDEISDDEVGFFDDETVDGSGGGEEGSTTIEEAVISRLIREMEEETAGEAGDGKPEGGGEGNVGDGLGSEEKEPGEEAGTAEASPEEVDSLLKEINSLIEQIEEETGKEGEEKKEDEKKEDEGGEKEKLEEAIRLILEDSDLEGAEEAAEETGEEAAEGEGEEAAEGGEGKKEDLDVDKKITENRAGLGPIMQTKDKEDLTEKFNIFVEQIQTEIQNINDEIDMLLEQQAEEALADMKEEKGEDKEEGEEDADLEIPEEKKESEKLEEALNILFEEADDLAGEETKPKADETPEEAAEGEAAEEGSDNIDNLDEAIDLLLEEELDEESMLEEEDALDECDK